MAMEAPKAVTLLEQHPYTRNHKDDPSPSRHYLLLLPRAGNSHMPLTTSKTEHKAVAPLDYSVMDMLHAIITRMGEMFQQCMRKDEHFIEHVVMCTIITFCLTVLTAFAVTNPVISAALCALILCLSTSLNIGFYRLDPQQCSNAVLIGCGGMVVALIVTGAMAMSAPMVAATGLLTCGLGWLTSALYLYRKPIGEAITQRPMTGGTASFFHRKKEQDNGSTQSSLAAAGMVNVVAKNVATRH